jgi:chaperonin GroES
MAKDKGTTTMKLKPLADRVIVKQTEAEEKTASGIYLPDAAKEKPTRGKVIAAGPGKLDDNGKPMELGVRVGDEVYYGKYSGTDVEVNGEKFVILRESDLLGVLEK